MIVVADASPLCYLVLIEHAHVLPVLYGRVVVPAAVVTELDHEGTPALVRKWLADRPDWVEVQRPREIAPALRRGLGPGGTRGHLAGG